MLSQICGSWPFKQYGRFPEKWHGQLFEESPLFKGLREKSYAIFLGRYMGARDESGHYWQLYFCGLRIFAINIGQDIKNWCSYKY